MKRSCGTLLLVPLSLAGVAASGYLPWEDLTPADALYGIATRFAAIEGHVVHYPTPTAELARALEAHGGPLAQRHLAEARFELGDRAGALAALTRWAEAEGPEAWAEAARWAADRLEMAFAFRAAERALPGLGPERSSPLHADRVRWADRHPELADPIALRKARSAALPDDAAGLEDYLRALEAAKRFDEADAALAGATILPPERRLLLRSDLLAARGELRRAFEVLDAAVDAPQGPDFYKAFVERTDQGAPESPVRWRARLESGFDAAALTRLAGYFQGQGRGDAAADLLRQIERRDERQLDRAGLQLLSRLWSEIDAVPEAFRAGLAAAQLGPTQEQPDDLARLARLALRAGGRALAWGRYNDESYRWAARLDRTAGFWTGALSFLLTGQDWKEALSRLESESVPERTFATARTLVDELVRRSAAHPEIRSLRAALMERHVERGEGREALALLPLVEAAGGAPADEARRIALLALRQVEGPLTEEARLYKARLQSLAADGAVPLLDPPAYSEYDVVPAESWRRLPLEAKGLSYRQVLDEAVSRLDQRDASHTASVALILGEMDRLPEAESVWLELASRLEAWNLDDELGPRYERALERFGGADWWSAAARFYARRSRHRDLRRLAEELTARFRGAELFDRAQNASVLLEIPEQPRVGQRVRLAPWSDWVRWKALARFPHSARVFREAYGRLQLRSAWGHELATRGAAQLARQSQERVIVEDSLIEERRWALLFSDPDRREEFFAGAMAKGDLESRLSALEASARTPVEDRLLFDGWARLSRFEQASAPADRLAAAYPGDAPLAQRVLALHRSLTGLDGTHVALARALVQRTAPALVDPTPLWTELGELEEERGHPEAALATWRPILDTDKGNPERVTELATLFWDYGHMKEALEVVERGRERLGRPRFFAFEAGVLREENRDIGGAVREYLNALEPETGSCYCSAFETDQRSLRRLAQLLGRARVRGIVESGIAALVPGRAEDEHAFAALLPLATISAPESGLDGDAGERIDRMDMPNDPLGRAARGISQTQQRPGQHEAIARIAEVLLTKAEAMLGTATSAQFADALEAWGRPLLEARDAERAIGFVSAAMGRRAALTPAAEDRAEREIAHARYLLDAGRLAEADALWAELPARIRSLPEGAARMRSEAARAAYLERRQGQDAAEAVWRELGTRYAWSQGVLQDRLAFLHRVGRDKEARRVLEAAVPQMGAGHRQAFLERLTREALEGRELAQARRGVERLLAEPELDPQHRLGAIQLLARLALKEDPAFDPATLATREAEHFKKELHADLYAQLARAAESEAAWPRASALWIEALNRRLERSWLESACRAADEAGRLAELLRFFETQQQRSPRDVRWAVAVREIRRYGDDVEGAILAAKAAVAVKPDRESLWREAADVMTRAGRVREAADFLEGWNLPRPADEGVVAWRGRLYAQLGDGQKALGLERAALQAFEREAPRNDERRTQAAERLARGSRRLLEYGYPSLALRLIAPAGELAKLAASRLSLREQAELAMANHQFLRFLRSLAGSEALRSAAAQALRENGRPEHREETLAWLIRQLFPGPSEAGDESALRRLWPFADEAGLERPLRAALGERWVRRTPGPWQSQAPTAFIEAVGREAVGQRSERNGRTLPEFRSPSLDALWARDLARRDRSAELAAFLDARLGAMLAEALASAPLPKGDDAELAWVSWLADRSVLEAWARGLAERPASRRGLASVFSRRGSWDRFWALGARRWEPAPLVAILPDDARAAWFRFWETAAPHAADARARAAVEEQVSLAVGRLVSGSALATGDPLITRLRGPRTLGDAIQPGPEWLWPEFGAGQERAPSALWGGQPGEAWFALETLARLRAGDVDAARLPLEAPQRGREQERARLGARLAERLGEPALALELFDAADSHEAAVLGAQLRLLTQTGRRADAERQLGEEVARQQASLSEDKLRSLEALAEGFGLTPPLARFDASVPLPPALLAYLHDQREDALASRFQTDDPVGFRVALAHRFSEREGSLTADQVRLALSELWARGAGELPLASLKRLGGLWPQSAGWLRRQLPADRGEAIAAVAALPDAAKLMTIATRRGQATDELTRLLLLRAALRRGDEAEGRQLFATMLAEVTREEPLSYDSVSVDTSEDQESWNEGEAPEASSAKDPLAARLEAWREAFREAKRTELVDESLRDFLRVRAKAGFMPVALWRLAFSVAGSDPERAVLDQALEHAWLRGDWQGEALQPLVEILAERAPALAPRWLSRWPPSTRYSDVAARAKLLARLSDPAGAAALLAASRARTLWSTQDEVRAFDAWRRVTPEVPSVPASGPWQAALGFWKQAADVSSQGLETHLRAHPVDVLAARVALRSLAPTPEEPLQRARIALAEPVMTSLGSPWADDAVVRVRIARGLLPAAPGAARGALESVDTGGLVDELVRRRFRAAEIDAALADLARILSRAGGSRNADALLRVLADRRAVGLAPLRAELLAQASPPAAPAAFRLEEGRPRPWRPRDLDWSVVGRVVDAGASR